MTKLSTNFCTNRHQIEMMNEARVNQVMANLEANELGHVYSLGSIYNKKMATFHRVHLTLIIRIEQNKAYHKDLAKSIAKKAAQDSKPMPKQN